MTPKEFNDCLNRIKNGDSRGMEPIYVNYYEKLVLTANCELHDRGRAEEVASSVMITIFENAGHYDYINFPDAWMYKAVKFAVIRQKQRLQREMLTDFSDFRYESKDEGMTFGIAFRVCAPFAPGTRKNSRSVGRYALFTRGERIFIVRAETHNIQAVSRVRIRRAAAKTRTEIAVQNNRIKGDMTVAEVCNL